MIASFTRVSGEPEPGQAVGDQIERYWKAVAEVVARYAEPDERRDVGLRIDPETAVVFSYYAPVLDPYHDGVELAAHARVIGRQFFAVDPIEGVAVSFMDLPDATIRALRGEEESPPPPFEVF